MQTGHRTAPTICRSPGEVGLERKEVGRLEGLAGLWVPVHRTLAASGLLLLLESMTSPAKAAHLLVNIR